jgi:hypothetical protein
MWPCNTTTASLYAFVFARLEVDRKMSGLLLRFRLSASVNPQIDMRRLDSNEGVADLIERDLIEPGLIELGLIEPGLTEACTGSRFTFSITEDA